MQFMSPKSGITTLTLTLDVSLQNSPKAKTQESTVTAHFMTMADMPQLRPEKNFLSWGNPQDLLNTSKLKPSAKPQKPSKWMFAV